MRRSEARPFIADYARERLRAELATKPRGAKSALARELRVTKSAITGFLGTRTTAPRGAGEDLLTLLAAHWGLSMVELEQLAMEGARKDGRLDRYPNRREAARICVEGGLRPDAVQHILEEEFDYAADPAVLLWIRMMLLQADQLNARSPLPARKASA